MVDLLKDAIWHYMDEKTLKAYGPWVRHADYATLSAEVSRLTQEVERLRSGRVKRLEWREEGTSWFADHACGCAQITYDDRATRETAYGWFNAGTWEWFATLDAAKAACQADYERRILSALSPEPSPGESGEPTLASIYADLAARQEPLGVDLGDYEDLYERDEPRAPAEPGEPQTTDDLDELIRRHRESIVAWADARHPECAHIPHPDRAPLAGPGEDEPVAWVSKNSLAVLHKDGSHVAVQTAIHRKPPKSGNGVPLYTRPAREAR